MLGRHVRLKGEAKEEFERFVIQMYLKDKLSVYTIAARTGRSKGAVANILHEHEVPLRKRGTKCRHKNRTRHPENRGRKIGSQFKEGHWKPILCNNCGEEVLSG